VRHIPVSLADVESAERVGAGEHVCFAVPRIARKVAGPLLEVSSPEPPFAGMSFRWKGAVWQLGHEVTEGKDRGLWMAQPAEQ
jgi:hypothetical protein